jgi:hypothetical protein
MYPSPTIKHHQHLISTKKTLSLYFFKHDRWNKEQVDIVWDHDEARRIQILINALLTLLEEEQIVSKKSSVQSVALNERKTYAYISFDRSFLDKETSTSTKMMIIESILKTLRENDITVQYIQLLVHHEPMHDQHLEISHPWPTSGFYEAAGNGTP